MNPTTIRPRSRRPGRGWLLALGCAVLIAPGAVTAQEKAAAPAQGKTTAPAAAPADSGKLPMAQIEALVAPIALYPDPLLAQTLVASTYPLEIIQLQQWMTKHPGLKDKALADSVAKQPWDPAIQSMAAVPEVVKRLADDIQWTTELGNAFLAQQTDVMDAVQVMRKKAVDKGALTSNEQQTVDTQVVEKQTVIVVQPTNPEVIYVPSYSPTVVYGPPVYPYPPIYYPPYPPGAAFVSFSIGMMWGAAMWGGSCCYAGWGHGNTVIINNNNNFNKINHYNGGGRGNNNWQHNPSHRGGTPYPNQNVSNRYGGGQGQRPGGGTAGRPSAGTQPAGGVGGRGPTAGTQPAGGAGGRGPTAGTQPAGGAGGRGPTAGTQPAGGAGRQPPTANMQPSGGTRGDQIGGRDVPSSRGGQSGFSGGQGGYSGSSARASSARGASSMGSYGGGASRGGGGARGGGGRGGGGRR